MTAPFFLVPVEGGERHPVLPGVALSLGRGVTNDLVVADPTISRRHAEIRVDMEGIRVSDLGSSNGTTINGVKVTQGLLRPFEVVTFGRVGFRLEPAPLAQMLTGSAGGTVVRQLRVEPSLRQGLAVLEPPPAEGGQLKVAAETNQERQAKKLELLLDLSQKLSGELDLDRLLTTVADATFEVMNVDRVSILLLRDSDGELIPRVSRSTLGESRSQHVPRSIAEQVVRDRVAVLSDNAAADSRFSGQSVLMQSVRSAMCTPLLSGSDRVLGILYVDSMTSVNSFSDEDLQFLVAFGSIAAAAIRNSLQAEQIRREALVRGNFERYFAPDVAAAISRSAGDVKLGGDRRPIAVLFSDIRGFTTLAEGMSPEAIAQLLTDYFTEMVDIIFEHGGTLDKFIGDAIMALWGAPLAQPDDAERALSTACAMQRALAQLNARWAAAGRPPVSVGIGLNFGEVFAGNIGSHKRLEYTVLGDAVNIASRLCAEAGPGEILVSGALKDVVSGAWTFEPVSEMSLRGKANAVEVFRVKTDRLATPDEGLPRTL